MMLSRARALALLLTFAVAALFGAAPQAQESTAVEELWVDVTLNRQQGFGTVLALVRDGDVLLAAGDLKRWRVELPEQATLQHYGESYHSLKQLNTEYSLNRSLMRLSLELPPELFSESKLQGYQRPPIELSPSAPGAYFNYDVTATHDTFMTSAAGFLELGLFNAWGSLNQTSVHRYNSDAADTESLRLNTVWRSDFPERMNSLYIGDFVTRSAGWSRDVRLAGIKWETNFATQPEMIKVPTLAFTGLATEPSTVDLYINDALRFRQRVPTGPFAIDELPSITGYGDVQVVVTDLLGRQRAISQSYFTDRRALRAGLHDYSYALGTVRQDYGLSSGDYSSWLTDIHHRYGVSNDFTAEVTARLSDDYQQLGVSGIQALPWQNSMTFALVGNHHSEGKGQLLQLGLQHQRRQFNFGVDAQKTFADFRISPQVQQQPLPYPKLQLRSYLSVSGTPLGNVRLAYTRQQRDDENLAFMNAGLTKHLPGLGHLSLHGLKFFKGEQDFQLSLALNIPFGKGANFSTGATHYTERDTAFMQVQRQTPVGHGVGYRLRQGFFNRPRSQADLTFNSSVGSFAANYSRTDNLQAYRATVRGSLSYVGGYLSLGQPVRDSFGLVHVPGTENVRVYAENQHIATTDEEGFAFIPRLRAYQRNRIRLDATDFPLSTTVATLQREIAPYHRSGVVITFPIASSASVMLNLVNAQGAFIPVGAKAYLAGQDDPVPVGYEGLLYLTDSQGKQQVEVHYQQNGEMQQCLLEFEVPQDGTSLHDLGKRTCDASV
ncbi:fimbrial biogenesis outer membrane usher protein [Pseudidiomarina sp. 1APR75-33.1]|uniref:fimbria/pilus outer membrane usher protein n=1 Tax=Pseudidiomarina terrestris TaxID=2820060 RepID=UPI0026570F0D|nr:fimbria/pilus outer membrane usher protein [Pseudidiomarina sp. 1APR75-33.1]MDN7126929.1 fimbrial biogenesis outer membrane usher protein [Pseudidiomarina sp. 1APR75-33.1]